MGNCNSLDGGIAVKRKFKVENMAVFIEFLVGGGLGIFFHWVLKFKEAALIIFGIGVLLSLMTYLLREELSRIHEGLTKQYKQCHEITFALAKINDPECRAKAEEVLSNAKKTIGSLQEGYIPLGETEFWLEAVRALDSAQIHIRSVDPVAAILDSRGAMMNLYNANLRALERGIGIMRIFLVNRDEFTEPDIQKGLAAQLKDGIDTRIVYRDEIPQTLDSSWTGPMSYNFTIYDDHQVTDVFATPGQYFGRKTTQVPEVSKYRRILELIEHIAYRLSFEGDKLVVSCATAVLT